MKTFDEWVELYKQSPTEFERERVEEIEKLILSAPQERQNNLRRLQWRIDEIRSKFKPLKATHMILMESINCLRDGLKMVKNKMAK